MSTHYRVPDIVGGYVLNTEHGWFSIIVPEATTNLIDTPSAENANIGCQDVGFGPIGRTTTYQRRGAWSVDGSTGVGFPDDGIVCFGSAGLGFSLTAGTTYTFSVDVLVLQAGTPMKIWFATNAGVQLGTPKQFRATGLWQRVWVTYTETASARRYLYVTKDNDPRQINLYVDGLQLEAKAYPTTYCDGDMKGFLVNETPPAYLWLGTPQLSISTRSAQTRTGGRIINLDTYDFLIDAYTVLGMPQPNNVATPFGLLDGALYQRTVYQPRTFVLSGTFETDGFQQLQRQRSQLIKDVSRDIVAQQQPMLLRYHPYKCKNPIGDEFNIICNYRSGLEGNIDNLYRERIPLQFTAFLPAIQRAGDSGSSLNIQTTEPDADYILQRSSSGLWHDLDGGLDALVYALTRDLSGGLYAGGNFSLASGNIVNFVARWNGTTWSGLDTGTNGTVFDLAVAADGTLYIGGVFTTAGGVLVNAIARWNGTAWSALGTGMNSQVRAVILGLDGTLYAGGDFTTAGGGAANRIARWTGAAWSALGTGMNGNVYALAVGLDGSIYAGGAFTTAGGVAANRVAKWDGSAWSALGSGMNAATTVHALAVGLDGTLYAGGDFTTAGGNTVNYIAQWNGSSWSDLSGGMNSDVRTLTVGPDGSLYAGGNFTTAGGLTLSDRIARWNGSTWLPLDVDLPGTPTVWSILAPNDTTLTVGYDGSGSARAAGVTTVTNNGTANAYPKIIIRATGGNSIHQLINFTTNDAIYFNYSLGAGETAILDLTPGNTSFTSSFQGNVMHTIIPGSSLTTWHLQPGNNDISLFAGGVALEVLLVWQDTFWSLDSAVV